MFTLKAPSWEMPIPRNLRDVSNILYREKGDVVPVFGEIADAETAIRKLTLLRSLGIQLTSWEDVNLLEKMSKIEELYREWESLESPLYDAFLPCRETTQTVMDYGNRTSPAGFIRHSRGRNIEDTVDQLVRRGRLEDIHWLRKIGADMTSPLALHAAASTGNKEVLRDLFKHGGRFTEHQMRYAVPTFSKTIRQFIDDESSSRD